MVATMTKKTFFCLSPKKKVVCIGVIGLVKAVVGLILLALLTEKFTENAFSGLRPLGLQQTSQDPASPSTPAGGRLTRDVGSPQNDVYEEPLNEPVGTERTAEFSENRFAKAERVKADENDTEADKSAELLGTTVKDNFENVNRTANSDEVTKGSEEKLVDTSHFVRDSPNAAGTEATLQSFTSLPTTQTPTTDSLRTKLDPTDISARILLTLSEVYCLRADTIRASHCFLPDSAEVLQRVQIFTGCLLLPEMQNMEDCGTPTTIRDLRQTSAYYRCLNFYKRSGIKCGPPERSPDGESSSNPDRRPFVSSDGPQSFANQPTEGSVQVQEEPMSKTYFTEDELKTLVWSVASSAAEQSLAYMTEITRQASVRTGLAGTIIQLFYGLAILMGVLLAAYLGTCALLIYGAIKGRPKLLRPWRLMMLFWVALWIGLQIVFLGALAGIVDFALPGRKLGFDPVFVLIQFVGLCYTAYCYWVVLSLERQLKKKDEEKSTNNILLEKQTDNGIYSI